MYGYKTYFALRTDTNKVHRYNSKSYSTSTVAVGSLTELAQQSLGHNVVIKRFMVTSCGRTGYLHPYQEQLPIAGTAPCLFVTLPRH